MGILHEWRDREVGRRPGDGGEHPGERDSVPPGDRGQPCLRRVLSRHGGPHVRAVQARQQDRLPACCILQPHELRDRSVRLSLPTRRVGRPARGDVPERLQRATAPGAGAPVPQAERPCPRHGPDLFRVPVARNRLPHLEVDFPATHLRSHRGVRWALVPDAPLPSARDRSFPLLTGRSWDRGDDADPVAAYYGCQRSTLEEAGQRPFRKINKE